MTTTLSSAERIDYGYFHRNKRGFERGHALAQDPESALQTFRFAGPHLPRQMGTRPRHFRVRGLPYAWNRLGLAGNVDLRHGSVGAGICDES